MHFLLQGLQISLLPPDPLSGLTDLAEHGCVGLFQGVGLWEQALGSNLAEQIREGPLEQNAGIKAVHVVLIPVYRIHWAFRLTPPPPPPPPPTPKMKKKC